jgi:hypothetical protein
MRAMTLPMLVHPPLPSVSEARPKLAAVLSRTSLFDAESLETVAVEVEYDKATSAARALEATARLLVNRSVRGVPALTRVRLDDPSLRQGIKAAAQELAGATRVKRLVLAVRLDSGSVEELEGVAEQARRSGLELALFGDPGDLLAHLGQTPGRLFAIGITAGAPTALKARLASGARRHGVPLLVHDIAEFEDLEGALQLGTRYVGGRALESKLRGRLLAAAKTKANDYACRVSSMRASEEDISRVRDAVVADPEARDLAELMRGWTESLDEVRREVEAAERAEARAAAMLVAAEQDLGQMLESFAAGNAHRAERLMRCEASFQEARVLEEMARARADAARRRAITVRAGLELRKEALRAALEARAARLDRDSSWAEQFFSASG